MSRARPAWDVPLADPAVVRTADGWIAYGTGPITDGFAVPAAVSSDLREWRGIGNVLEALPADAGDSYWAPEVCERDGAWWMYYSVGHGDAGHLVRVARADGPEGPFLDQQVVLTPDELFAIDASPCRLADGSWWLFFARDVLEHERPGTHLAAAPLLTPTSLGEIIPILAPYEDWQIYERDRPMYSETYTWHTLEGPHVLVRDGMLLMTYSGGSWQGPGYRTAWSWATSPAGPWTVPPSPADVLLQSDDEFIGPGHNSCTTGPDGRDVIAFHAWDEEATGRYMHLRELEVIADPPSVRVTDRRP